MMDSMLSSTSKDIFSDSDADQSILSHLFGEITEEEDTGGILEVLLPYLSLTCLRHQSNRLSMRPQHC